MSSAMPTTHNDTDQKRLVNLQVLTTGSAEPQCKLLALDENLLTVSRASILGRM
jgi:hypothetical protein